MKTFYITVSRKYLYGPHPHGGHPDGWFEIEAENEDEAREIAFKNLGAQWAHIYGKEDFSFDLYPKGCLKKLSANPLPAAGVAPSSTT